MKKLIILTIPFLVLSGCIKVETYDPCEGSANNPVVGDNSIYIALGELSNIVITNHVSGNAYYWSLPDGSKDTTYTSSYQKFISTSEYDGAWKVQTMGKNAPCVSEQTVFSMNVNNSYPNCSTGGDNYIKIGSLNPYQMSGKTTSSSNGFYSINWTNPTVTFTFTKKGGSVGYDDHVYKIVDQAQSQLNTDECILNIVYNGLPYKGKTGKFYTTYSSSYRYLKFCEVVFESNTGSTIIASGSFRFY